MAATSEVLGSLHDVLTAKLLEKIESGEATAADMAVARGLLKDNHITCIPAESTAISALEQRLKEREQKRKFPRLVSSKPDEVALDVQEAAEFMVAHGS